MKNKEIPKIYTVIAVLIVWIISGIGVYGLYYISTLPPSSMNDFCDSLGFDKATDFKDLGFCLNDNYKAYYIECDKENIYNVISEEICKDYDKWGDCYWTQWNDYKITNEDCK